MHIKKGVGQEDVILQTSFVISKCLLQVSIKTFPFTLSTANYVTIFIN
jgi:hypothetical protein